MKATWVAIKGIVQAYDWGKKGSQSLVAKLSGENDCEGRFAELWFGDHPRGPARCISDPLRSLRDLLASEPSHWLGPNPRFSSGSLPFLMKVLSIDSAAGLSLQVHPSKPDVERLYQTSPNLLADRGVKAEMGIARTVVKLFMGIRPYQELQSIVPALPGFASFVDDIENLRSSSVVRELCKKLLSLDDERGAIFVRGLVDTLDRCGDRPLEVCFSRLREQYGDCDPGLRLLPLLNLITLQPGQAIFIEPGTIHAYLEGDLVECMVSSDNVLRAGLTKKEVQREVVAECTNWNPAHPELLTMSDSPRSPLLRRFDLSSCTQEFVLDSCEQGNGTFTIDCTNGPSMAFVAQGALEVFGDNDSEIVGAGNAILFNAVGHPARLRLIDATLYLVGTQ